MQIFKIIFSGQSNIHNTNEKHNETVMCYDDDDDDDMIKIW